MQLARTSYLLLKVGPNRPRAVRSCSLVMLAAVLFGASILAFAQNDTDSSHIYSVAPVRIDGAILFEVHGIAAYPASERAAVIERRIREWAADEEVSPEALRVVDSDDMSSIFAGRHFIMGLTNADAQQQGVRRPVLATLYRDKLAEAVRSYRHERSPPILLRKAAYAIGATVVFMLSLWASIRGSRRYRRVMDERYSTRVHDVHYKSFQLLRADRLLAGIQASLRVVRDLIVVLLVYVYLGYVLALFPWTRYASQRLLYILLDPVTTAGRALIDAAPNMIFIAILIVLTRYLLKLTRLFFLAIAEERVSLPDFDHEWALPTYKLVRLFVFAIALVIAYPYIPGSDSDAFKGVSILLGVLVSLGSTSAISSIVAGYTMTYRRAFRLGDRVQVAEFVGDVLQKRLLVTRLRSLKNEEIVVPNSLILNSNVVNYNTLAAECGLILHTTVGIGYEVPWRQVEAMLMESAARTEGLLREPEPFVLQLALGDFAVTYELNAYCDEPTRMMALYTELHRNILDIFNEYGVQIMTPAYETDPEQPKLVPKGRWFETPAKVPGGESESRR